MSSSQKDRPIISATNAQMSICCLLYTSSNIYTVFEVKDENELLPEYLMLWLSRPEFDRYARFKSHGSVREIMDWDEMCKVELPVPSIERQQMCIRDRMLSLFLLSPLNRF